MINQYSSTSKISLKTLWSKLFLLPTHLPSLSLLPERSFLQCPFEIKYLVICYIMKSLFDLGVSFFWVHDVLYTVARSYVSGIEPIWYKSTFNSLCVWFSLLHFHIFSSILKLSIRATFWTKKCCPKSAKTVTKRG